MAVTITCEQAQSKNARLGDLDKGSFFTFAKSTKDTPNLYQKNANGYVRMKTGKWFRIIEGDVLPGDEGHASLASDKVVPRDVNMQYA